MAGSPLLRGGGFAGSNMSVQSTGGYTFGQTVQIGPTVQCLSFLAVASSRLKAWVYIASEADRFLRDPHYSLTPVAACSTSSPSSYCNITLNNLNSSVAYTMFYQPDYGTTNTPSFVAYSLTPSKQTCVFQRRSSQSFPACFPMQVWLCKNIN